VQRSLRKKTRLIQRFGASFRLAPEELDTPHAYSPERDIWYAGLALVQMLFGVTVLLEHPSLASIIDNGT
jgi:hypothetical protein